MLTRRRRSGFGISLRMMMMLVLVVGGALAWQVRRAKTQQAAVATILRADGVILYDYEVDPDPERRGLARPDAEPLAPRWLRRWLGDDLFRTVAEVRLVSPVRREVALALGSLDGLTSLSLNLGPGTQVDQPIMTPELFAEATRSPRLTRLVLMVHGMDNPDLCELDELLAVVGGVTSLREVALFDHLAERDAAHAALGRLPHLESLRIAACPDMTDARLARLLVRIRSGLSSFELSSEPARSAPLPRGSGIGVAAGSPPLPPAPPPEPLTRTWEALRVHHPALDRLQLSRGVDGTEFAAIGRLTSLTSFRLARQSVTDEDLRSLAPLVHLTTLDLQAKTVTDEGVRHLASLRRLRTLFLRAPGLTDAAMKTIGGFVDLETLGLAGSAQITDAGLAPLVRLTHLKGLHLGSGITDAGMPTLARLSGLRNLTLGTGITDAGATALGKLVHLERLSFGGPGVTDAALTHLTGLARLKFLGVGRTGITRAGVDRFRAACPDATVHLAPNTIIRSANQVRADEAEGATSTATGP